MGIQKNMLESQDPVCSLRLFALSSHLPHLYGVIQQNISALTWCQELTWHWSNHINRTHMILVPDLKRGTNNKQVN